VKATTIGCLPTQALAFLAVFVYATQAFAFEWKPGFSFMEGMGSHAWAATHSHIGLQLQCVLKLHLKAHE